MGGAGKHSLLRTPIGKKPWLWQKSWGWKACRTKRKSPPGLFITDETLDSVCLIYKAPDDEIVYRYLDADGNTRSALRDFLRIWQGSCKPKEREVTHNGNAAYQLPMPCLYRSASL